MSSSQREETLGELCAPQNQDIVTGLLISSKEVRIAVPCAVLSNGAAAAGSKVVVNVLRSQGANLRLECGQWWRGAPSSPVYMDFRQLLQYANDDALRALHRKLVAVSSSRNRGLARTQSVPGRILFEEFSSGGHGSGSHRPGSPSRLLRTGSSGLPPSGGSSGLQRTSSTGSSLQRTSSTGAGLQRTSSVGLPPSGSSLRRTSSTGIPSSTASSARQQGSSSGSVSSGGSGNRPSSSHHRQSAQGLHRLSACARMQSPGSAAGGGGLGVGGVGAAQAPGSSSQLGTPQKQEMQVNASEEGTPEQQLSPFTPFQGAGSSDQAHSSTATPARLSFDSPDDTLQHPQTASGLLADSSADFSPDGSGSPFDNSSPRSVAGIRSAEGVGPLHAHMGQGQSSLAKQASFSKPYFAEFEDDVLSLQQQQKAAEEAAAAAALAEEESGAARAAQLIAAVGQNNMTTEQLHEVGPSFNHVFVPPWAVPAAPEEQVVRTYREAGMQTSTGVADERPRTRQTHTAEDVADHFQAFMQHFSAALPHLAMALADMHLGVGGEDPTFIKSQYYFNSLLQLKDEMNQLGERLGQAADNTSSL